MAPSNLCRSLQWDHVLLPCPRTSQDAIWAQLLLLHQLPASVEIARCGQISPKFGQMFDNSYTNHWIFSETYMSTVFRNQVCTLYVWLIYIHTTIYWYTMIGLVCYEPFNVWGFPSCTTSNEVHSTMKLFSRCRFGPTPVQSLAMTWALALPPKKNNAETNYATTLWAHGAIFL